MELELKNDTGMSYRQEIDRCTRKELQKWIADNKRPEGVLAAVWQAWSKEELVQYIRSGSTPATCNVVPRPRSTGVFDQAIEQIVEQVLERRTISAALDEEAVEILIKKYLSKPVQYTINTGTSTSTYTPKQQEHALFPLVAKLIAAKINVYLHGTFGTGKTKLAEHVCEMLGVDYHIVNFTPQSSESGLTGYMWGNEYIKSTVRDCMESGKALILDEADACNPAIFLRLCALLSSRTMSFPDGKRVDAHDNFFVIACGNTTMGGATQAANGRLRQDRAIVDRFAMVFQGIDDSLEASFLGISEPSEPVDIEAGGLISKEYWLGRVRKARAAQTKLGIECTISPRASILGAQMIDAGIGLSWLDSCVLFRGLSTEQVTRIQAEL